MAEKATALNAFEFFDSVVTSPLPPIVACFGSDDYLRRESIRHWVQGSGIEEESVRSFEGEEAAWRDVHDQLATRSLFDDMGTRIAIVRNADKFVTKFRESLEKWIESSPGDCTLILEIQTFPRIRSSTTQSPKKGSSLSALHHKKRRGEIHPMTKRSSNG